MQINKKMLTTAITALLLLSIVTAAAPAFAVVNSGTGVWLTSASATPIGDIASRNVGQRVQVIGAAPNATANPGNTVNVYWDVISPASLLGTVATGATGAFAINVTVPSAVNGAHFIVVSDGSAPNLFQPLAVTASLTASPTRVLQVEAVTLTGTGFAASTATTITFNGGTFTAVIVTPDLNGTFTASIVIPLDTPLSATAYTATATQGALAPTAAITVNYYLTVTPSGLAPAAPVPPGVTVTFAGRITPSTAFSIAIDTVPVASGTSDATGRFSVPYPLPTLIAVTTHTVSITAGALVVPSVNLRTGESPTASLSVASGAAGAVITLTLAHFDSSANVTLKFDSTTVNSTVLDSRFGPTASDGSLITQFSVPALTPSLYTVTVTDVFGAAATVVGGFTVSAAPVTTITSSATSYVQGDTITFSISTTDVAVVAAGVNVAIKDPSGLYQYGIVGPTGIPLGVGTGYINWDFVTVGISNYVPVSNQWSWGQPALTLPTNAATGVWNWTISYTATGAVVPTLVTGLFTVNAAGTSGGVSNADLNATLATINTKLNTLNGTVNGLTTSVAALQGTVTSISGSIATISSGMTSVTTSVNSLSASISSITSGVATINTKLGDVTASLSSIDAVLGYVAGDTATITTTVGTLTTSLASIGTTVTSIQGNVATIQTDLGTLTGTVTSVSGNVATIQTSIGTMQADISTLKADVVSTKDSTGSLSTLVIVAIVLALVAAMAAIASIVLMRRKIAG